MTSDYKFGRSKTLSLIIYEIIAVERPQQYRFLWYVILLVFSRSKTIQFNVYFYDWVSEKKNDSLTRLPLDRKHCWSGFNVSFCYCKESFLVPFFFIILFFWSKTVQKFLLGNQKTRSQNSQSSQLYFSFPIIFPFLISSNTLWIVFI
jgi:hypothetical protein